MPSERAPPFLSALQLGEPVDLLHPTIEVRRRRHSPRRAADGSGRGSPAWRLGKRHARAWQAWIDEYIAAYASVKAPRKLRWKRAAG